MELKNYRIQVGIPFPSAVRTAATGEEKIQYVSERMERKKMYSSVFPAAGMEICWICIWIRKPDMSESIAINVHMQI